MSITFINYDHLEDIKQRYNGFTFFEIDIFKTGYLMNKKIVLEYLEYSAI